MTTRRNFIKNTALGAAGITLLSSTKMYGNILGSNTKVNIAILGTGGRAHGLAKAVKLSKNGVLTHICDVDVKILENFKGFCKKEIGVTPETEQDFRNILKNKDIDAVLIATPEHWHAPMSIMAMQAGKHVYVEKPCSHNAYETELLVKAQKKYNKVVQMGNQQRSSTTSALAIKEINEGIIGDVYAGKAFYANTRKSIGVGKKIAVPNSLDWDLWQGPAPREDYRNNVHPYNWHWFKTWGTGEIHNNGTHEIDICRWALGVDYPNRVSSSGGRMHFKNDDWQYYDTQFAHFEFDNEKMITWEGKSCNGYNPDGGRGATITGTKGSIKLNRARYQLLDLKGKVIKTEWEANKTKGTANNTSDTRGFGDLTVGHMQNFINAIVDGEALKAPIADASISTQLCHLGNISQALRESLNVDSKTGRVLKNKKADKLWKRDYAKGWEPKL